MNKQIKELKERVRLTDEELDAAWDSIPLYTEDDVGRKFAIADSQLNKVLNDKDLALIDREKVGLKSRLPKWQNYHLEE